MNIYIQAAIRTLTPFFVATIVALAIMFIWHTLGPVYLGLALALSVIFGLAATLFQMNLDTLRREQDQSKN